MRTTLRTASCRTAPWTCTATTCAFPGGCVDATGQLVAQGTDFAVLDAEQRFSAVTGFLDPVTDTATGARS